MRDSRHRLKEVDAHLLMTCNGDDYDDNNDDHDGDNDFDVGDDDDLLLIHSERDECKKALCISGCPT